MNAAVPTIEVADDADALCTGGPNGEVSAADAFECDYLGAEFLVSVVMAALDHQIQVELAEHNRKGIGIEDFEGLAEVRAPLNLVTRRGWRRGLVRRPGSFEEAFGAKFQGVGDFRGGKGSAFNARRLQRDAGFRGPREEEPHRPVAADGMRAEEGKG